MGIRFAAASRGTPAQYQVSETLGEALDGADIVVVSILPGEFDDMAQDLGIPAHYGIPQAVGDTVGPGGFVRAMRAIPMLAEIGEAVGKFAPDAYVCNLTNPMSVLTGALFRAFPAIKCWGECHEVTKIRKQVAWIGNREKGEERWTHRDVEVNVLGINHFTFVDRIALDGRDMMPAYRAFVDEHAETGWAQVDPGKGAEHNQYFGSSNLVSFSLCHRFGIPAAAGDRHLAEFLPAESYLANPEPWGFALTPVDYRIRDREAKRQAAEALADGRTAPLPKASDEALVDQIVALMGGDSFISNVNLPNRGQITGLPEGAIVESNAVFAGLGVTPVLAGRLPAELESIVFDHATRQTALLDAVLEGDKDALFPLFYKDPLVAPLPRQEAEKMFSEMVAATSSWLPADLRGAA